MYVSGPLFGRTTTISSAICHHQTNKYLQVIMFYHVRVDMLLFSLVYLDENKVHVQANIADPDQTVPIDA